MATSMKKDDSVDLLYPDLLSKEGLIFHLKKRYIRTPTADLEALDKESLVDIYNDFILPLPQRKYRDNLRGREMKKRQILKDKRKRKFISLEDSNSEPDLKKGRLSQDNPSGPSKGLVNTFSTSPATSRLKSPPSCIDTNKKVVKLSSSSSLPSVPSSQQSPTKEESEKVSSPPTSSKKVIRLNSNEKTGDAAVKVKRSANGADEKDESPKKKFKPIQWP